MSSRSAKSCVMISAIGFLWSFVSTSAVFANNQDGPIIVVDAMEQATSPIQNPDIRKRKRDNGTIGKIETARPRRGRAVHQPTLRRGQPEFRQNTASANRVPTRPSFSGGTFANRFAEGINRNGNVRRVQSPQEFMRMRRQFGLPAIRVRNVPAAGNVHLDQMFDGMININGREFRANNFDQMRRLQQQFGMPMPNLQNRNGNNQQVFDGMINNNGQIRRFDDADEFNRAQKRLFKQ
ncbi:MAG: hypothetical protein ACPGLY_17145 [Rubripirellula sp.]